MELLVGCGSNHTKRMSLPGSEEWKELITLDIDPTVQPDVVHDLNIRPLPFPDDHFDEIHAYEVLEHLGRQGDWRDFFAQWTEWYRILKPGGVLFGTSPHWSSPWAWSDPGHAQIISGEKFVFLMQPNYDTQIGNTAMTDYRHIYKADFDCPYAEVQGENFIYAMQAVKPSRCSI